MSEIIEINPRVVRFLQTQAGQRTVDLFRREGRLHPVAETVRFYNAVVGDLARRRR